MNFVMEEKLNSIIWKKEDLAVLSCTWATTNQNLIGATTPKPKKSVTFSSTQKFHCVCFSESKRC